MAVEKVHKPNEWHQKYAPFRGFRVFGGQIKSFTPSKDSSHFDVHEPHERHEQETVAQFNDSVAQLRPLWA
jgi:hypothetical protein